MDSEALCGKVEDLTCLLADIEQVAPDSIPPQLMDFIASLANPIAAKSFIAAVNASDLKKPSQPKLTLRR